MRMGMWGRKHPPHKAVGIALIVIGGIIMLLALPLFFWVAVIGVLVAWVGHSLRSR